MKKCLLSVLVSCFGIAAFSQSPTTVTPATTCNVSHSFDNSHEGFSSPSIYSDANDVEFRWDAGAGAEIERSGLFLRTASLISPVYLLGTSGFTTVGFKFAAPIGTEYRIRIISAITSSPLEVLATTSNGPVYTALTSAAGTICVMLTDQDLTVGRLIRFEFTFRAVLPGNILFDDMSIAIASGGPLPVTFEGFVARQNNDGSLKLLWNVSEELNVEGYAVESSTNGTSFRRVGYVTATGKNIYGLELPEKQLQTMYYRVKNIDVAGNSKYTTIIKVYNKEQTSLQIQLYPMPATDIATLQHSRSEANALITVFSQEGKLMFQVRPVLNSLQTQLKINTLASGLYFVRFDDGSGAVQSIKLLKN
jgi:hypothetical protein